jgi:hypothetical protein
MKQALRQRFLHRVPEVHCLSFAIVPVNGQRGAGSGPRRQASHHHVTYTVARGSGSWQSIYVKLSRKVNIATRPVQSISNSTAHTCLSCNNLFWIHGATQISRLDLQLIGKRIRPLLHQDRLRATHHNIRATEYQHLHHAIHDPRPLPRRKVACSLLEISTSKNLFRRFRVVIGSLGTP